MRCLSAVTVAGTVRVPIFNRYERPGNERVLGHPNHVRGELIDEFGRIARVGQQIAARNVDLVGEGQGHRVAGAGAIERAVEGDDLADPGRSARAGEQYLVAGRDRARNDRPGEAAESTRSGD